MLVSVDDVTLKKVVLHSVAIASASLRPLCLTFASSVLPVPGGPVRMAPYP